MQWIQSVPQVLTPHDLCLLDKRYQDFKEMGEIRDVNETNLRSHLFLLTGKVAIKMLISKFLNIWIQIIHEIFGYCVYSHLTSTCGSLSESSSHNLFRGILFNA